MEHPSFSYPSHLIPLFEGGLLVLLIVLFGVFGIAGARSKVRGIPLRVSLPAAFLIGLLGNALITAFHGFPLPHVSDANAYVLAAETFALGRLSNPAAPHPALVPEQVLQDPFVSKYPPAQGLFLSLGQRLGEPGLSLWLGSGLLLAAMLWCFRGWMPNRWAVLGALLVGLRLAIGSYWNHTFWGGSVAAVGGALVYGGLGRVREDLRLAGVLPFASGLVILAFSRPFEGFLAVLPAGLYLAWLLSKRATSRRPGERRSALRAATALLLVGVPAIALLLGYNKAITGELTRFPHQQYRERPSAGEFVWELWVESKQNLDYWNHDVAPEERQGWWKASARYLVARSARGLYFLVGPVLTLCLILGLPWLIRATERRLLVASVVLVFVGHALVGPYFPHYSAPIAAPLWLASLLCLRMLVVTRPRFLPAAASMASIALLIELLSFAVQLPALRQDDDSIKVRMIRQTEELEERGGRHLVLVDPSKVGITNPPDLRDAAVLWANDRGPESTSSLLELFPDRTLWTFDPYREPALSPLDPEHPTALGGATFQ